MNRKTLILLDVFSILHRAYHALPPLTSPKGIPIGGVYGVVSSVLKVVEQYEPYAVIACTDVKGKTYRHKMFDAYKGTRPELPDDFVPQIQLCFDFFEAFGIPVVGKEGYEADDVIGTFSSVHGNDMRVLIASSDQDLLALINKHVSVILFSKGSQGVLYTKGGVVERFGFAPKTLVEYKGLRGDTSDNIPGVKGIGEVTAKKILAKYLTLEKVYEGVEKDELIVTPRVTTLLKGSKDQAFLSRELATIQTDLDISTDVLEWIAPYESLLDFLRLYDMKRLIKNVEKKQGNETEKGVLFEKVEEVDPAFLKEVGVAFWVLDSTQTDAPIEDILSSTNTSTLEDAYSIIQKELKKKKLFTVFETIEKPLIPIIAAMENRGVSVSEKKLMAYNMELLEKKDILTKEIHALSSTDFNPASPSQVSSVLQALGVFLKAKTAGGALTTNKQQLNEVKDQHCIVPLLLEYRSIHKLQTGYTQSLLNHRQKDGKIHASFLQNGTATGRMASRNPNLQNIPKHGEYAKKIRNTFTASRGFTFLSIDYSQIEIRIAALLSKDKNFLNVISEGNDIHKETAKQLFQKQDITKEERDRAKQINFGILYGMGARALAKNMDISFTEAQNILTQYKKQFLSLQAYLDSLKEDVYAKGFVSTYFGRKRFFSDVGTHNFRMRTAIERAAINAPMQGTCADMVKISMIYTDKYIQKKYRDNVFLLIQVHDELLFEVKKGMEEEVASSFCSIMEKEILPNTFVSFPTEVSVGSSWGSLKPL